MPLSKIQAEILKLLASHRDPESYVAGATPLNRDGERFSEDIDVASAEPIDPKDTLGRVRAALDDADAFVARMPTDRIGLLFLKDGKVAQPDPGRLDDYQTHAGQRRGHWPTSTEITAAMLERYVNQVRQIRNAAAGEEENR